MIKAPKRAKLTDAERYKRFLDAAKEVSASDSYEDFDAAFRKITAAKKSLSSAPKSKGTS